MSDMISQQRKVEPPGCNPREWLPVGVVAQWQSIGMESQRPWVRIPVAPPFFPALNLFQRSMDVKAQLSSDFGVLTVGLQSL